MQLIIRHLRNDGFKSDVTILQRFRVIIWIFVIQCCTYAAATKFGSIGSPCTFPTGTPCSDEEKKHPINHQFHTQSIIK